jgi:hypothetical protein
MHDCMMHDGCPPATYTYMYCLPDERRGREGGRGDMTDVVASGYTDTSSSGNRIGSSEVT